MHEENPIVELDREPLIPFMVSREGPALAVGDPNGILLAFAVLLLLFIGFYFLIPNQINITRTISIHAAQNAVLRCLAEKQKWEKWWPQQSDL